MVDKRGKITLSVIIVSVVLVNFFSMYFVLALDTNTKIYDSETKTVTVKNGATKISKIQLNTPLIYNVIRGKDRLVAEFTIESFEDYADAFNEMDFYNVNDGMKKFDRDFSYKYKTYYDVTVPDYETVCNEKIVANGTEKYDCVQNQIGSHIEQKSKWNDFNKKAKLPKGTITIGIFTDVYAGDYVEWIPTLFGIEISEWATWQDSWSVGLFGHFNCSSNLNSISSHYNLNDTSSYFYQTINSKTGFGGYCNFTNPQRMFILNTGNTTNPYGFYAVTEGSICLWARGSEQGNDRMIVKDDGPHGWQIKDFGGLGSWRLDSDFFALDVTGTTDPISFVWQFICGTRNQTHASLYVDGSLEAIPPKGSHTQVSDFVWLGGDYSAGEWGGGMDEIGFWNRSLSASEISDLWNNGDGVIYEPPSEDTTSPNVTINSPLLDQTYGTSVTFNVTALDDTAMGSCLYSLNSGATNHTMDNSSTSPDDWTATNTTMAQGYHTVIFYCNDDAGNLNNTESLTFIIDSIAPNTTTPILNSTDGTNRSDQDLNCYATLTDDQQENLTAYWTWYKDDVIYLSGSKSVTDGSHTLITTLDSGNTSKGQEWICEVKPFDGYNYGTAINSSSITILNSLPTHNNPSLKTTTGKNLSTEDLICYNQSTSDADGDEVINIYNWYKNSQTFLALNLPFENNVNDYSGNNNDGTINGASFTDGKIGKALEFNGIDDYVQTSKNFGISFNSFSAEAWVNLKDIGTQHRYILERDDIHFYISVTPERKIRFRHIDLINGETETESNAIEFNEWTHIAVVYDGTKTYIYINGELKKEQEDTGNISFSASEHLYVGSSKYAPSYPDRTWNGSIDEVKIYPYALTPEQIYQNYLDSKDGLTSSSTIVSQQTSGGDEWMCQVTPNDGEADGETLNSSELEVLWAIEFDVRDSYSNVSLNYVTISCNYSEFNQEGDTTNPYGVYGFPDGNWRCEFEEALHYNKTIIFNADEDKVISVGMSEELSLTGEEHTWLEAIYNCLYSGDCSLYNLLLEVNQTVSNIWEHTAPTDEGVVTFENITNKIVDSNNNLTIDYSVDIPIKAGYSLGAYLPIRIGYFFLDTNNETCYNQGDKPTGVSDPYCQPLIIETLGPMGGTITFTVELQPALVSGGNYSIKRVIDIDPLGVWYNYGSEVISDLTMLETLISYGAGSETTGQSMPISGSESSSNSESFSSSSSEGTTKKITNVYNTYNTINEQQTPLEDGVIHLNKPGITGGAIGTGLFSGGSFVLILGIFAGLFALYIVSRIIIKLKKK